MGKTKIEWCDYTFNHVRGCTKISEGCKNCYAETQSSRFPLTLGVWGPSGTRVVAAESTWEEPRRWNKAAAKEGVRKRVFCASFADVFEDWQGSITNSFGDRMYATEDGWHNEGKNDGCPPLTINDVRRRLFDLIDATPHLDWLLLTKRPQNITRMMPPVVTNLAVMDRMKRENTWRGQQFRPNVWLGVSVENQAAANERIPHLQKVPAKVRFLSCEPLLEDLGELDITGIHWVIVGGESGTDARPCNIDWIRSIVRQCKAAGVPCFVKQLGSNPFVVQNIFDAEKQEWREKGWGKEDLGFKDSKGGNPDEWPEDLRVREFPQVGATT